MFSLQYYKTLPHLAACPNRPDYSAFNTPVSDRLAAGGLWLPPITFLLSGAAELNRFTEALEQSLKNIVEQFSKIICLIKISH